VKLSKNMTMQLIDHYRRCAVSSICMIVVLLHASGLVGQFAEPDPKEKLAPQNDSASADRYILKYPVAKQFCLPLRSYADDVTQTTQRVGNLTFRVKANGGYGLPVVDKIGDKHLLHLGADVGWQQIGAPVYAIADGVVRISEGPALDQAKKVSSKESHAKIAKNKDQDEAQSNDAKAESASIKDLNDSSPSNLALAWGNLIVIEHQVGEGVFLTSVYGHLGSERFVKSGDIVKAGKVIGTIGKMGVENGGYRPHLHFGLREGRMFQPGSVLCELVLNGKVAPIKITAINEDEVELKSDVEIPASHTIFQNGKNVGTIITHDGKQWLPTSALKALRQRDFPIVGYGLTTRGWLDPTVFLKKALANSETAPFGKTPESRVEKPLDQKR
jgi:murein DD-endopeptidase MepM/ murein hydrolase activator NlpD